MKGYTLLEMLVVVLIIGILSAVALPYYFNAVENARLTELRLLWGRGKNYLAGKNFSSSDLEKINEQLQKAKLNDFTAEIVCREGNTPCWEVVFTRQGGGAQYQITSEESTQSTTSSRAKSLSPICLNHQGACSRYIGRSAMIRSF